MWFQDDEVPAQFNSRVHTCLNTTFGARRTGRGRPFPWPPWILNLTPFDYFLWRYLKNLVYETPHNSDEYLVACTSEAASRVREIPGIIERVRQSFHRRCVSLLVDAILNRYCKHCTRNDAFNKNFVFPLVCYLPCLRFTTSLAPIHSCTINDCYNVLYLPLKFEPWIRGHFVQHTLIL